MSWFNHFIKFLIVVIMMLVIGYVIVSDINVFFTLHIGRLLSSYNLVAANIIVGIVAYLTHTCMTLFEDLDFSFNTW